MPETGLTLSQIKWIVIAVESAFTALYLRQKAVDAYKSNPVTHAQDRVET